MQKPNKKHNVIESSASLVSLSRKILLCANKGLSRKIFRSEILKLLISECKCDSIELRIIEYGKLWLSEYSTKNEFSFSLLKKECRVDKSGKIVPSLDIDSDLESIYQDIYLGRYNTSLPYYTKNGSFFTGNTELPLELSSETCKWAGGRSININCGFKSISVIPLIIDN
ncbi:MAG: hypothetical protein GY865_13030, partial [candidate division Zixibacteria bacterium]|nr:hypothetical protein [candidate division Zixibacteria bacterium]